MLAGSVAHRVLFQLLSPGDGPDALATAEISEVLARTDSLLRRSCASAHARRALRQGAAGAVLTYVRHLLPPSPWQVAAVDVPVDGGRIDVLWHTDADLLIDEIKTGQTTGTLTSTTRQVERYLRSAPTAQALHARGVRGVRLHGHVSAGHLIGARVLMTASPSASWFQSANGTRTSLAGSALQQCRCRPPPP
jgi:hypothetical protein